LKKETKIKLLGVLGLLAGAMVLSGCTANLCSNIDKANIAYPYEQGVTVYCDADQVPTDYEAYKFQPIAGNDKVYAYIPVNSSGYYAAAKATFLTSTIISTATTNTYSIPSQEYFKQMDQKVLDACLNAAISDKYVYKDANNNPVAYTKATVTAEMLNAFSKPDCIGNETGVSANNYSILRNYGYLKFYGSDNTLWGNWTTWNNELKASLGDALCPTTDFVTLYKNDINNKIANIRTCIATTGGKYGHYGNSSNWEVSITEKTWSDAWKTNDFLTGLIVWPVAKMVDTFAMNMDPNLTGWGQIWSIVLVTLIVRAFVLLCTFKSTLDQQKTQALQPELAKIQAKYPNSNTNKAEAQRLSQEQMALYKRNKVNPASMFLAMIVQFPVFIAVWGALQGSAVLSSGEVLNLRLSDTIRDVLFNTTGLPSNINGWWTALILFLLMSVFQWLSMMLPQWMTKRMTKSQTKVSANPAADKNTQTMKWVSYGMLIFTIIMGFSLPAAMGVYWAIGALISMIQTVITQMIMAKKKAKEKRL
jgi:YidC/Oxa1 family membrane protein insertase